MNQQVYQQGLESSESSCEYVAISLDCKPIWYRLNKAYLKKKSNIVRNGKIKIDLNMSEVVWTSWSEEASNLNYSLMQIWDGYDISHFKQTLSRM